MASGTRTVTGIGIAVFDFDTIRDGTVSFFSNDLNISFNVQATSPQITFRLHTGPILFLASAQVSKGFRVQIVPTSISGGFPVPPLSLVQLQTDTVRNTPTELGESDPWEQS